MKSSTPWKKIEWVLPTATPSIPLPELSQSIEETRESHPTRNEESFRIQIGLEVLNSAVFQSLVDNDVRVAVSAHSDLLTQPDVWDDLMQWSEEKT
jgi:hypothetical protein